jgi:hypothetical protein
VFESPVLVEKLDFPSLSACIVTSLLTGAGDCRPENFMVKIIREGNSMSQAAPVARVTLLGVTADHVFARTALKYRRFGNAFSTCAAPNVADILRLRQRGNMEVGAGFNALYFLPQMDEPVDRSIGEFLVSAPTIPEEIVCSWLKFMVIQNKRYNALLQTGGFNDKDFAALKLPLRIPLGAAIRMLHRLQVKLSSSKNTDLCFFMMIFVLFIVFISLIVCCCCCCRCCYFHLTNNSFVISVFQQCNRS